MQPNAQDLTYSIYRPDLAALGAIDGFMLSGLPISNNDLFHVVMQVLSS